MFGQLVRFIHVQLGGPALSLSWLYSFQLIFLSRSFSDTQFSCFLLPVSGFK